MSMFEIFVVAAAVIGTGLAVYLWVNRAAPTAVIDDVPTAEPVTFLFDGEALHHATQTAQASYGMTPGLFFWEDLRSALEPRFPDFPDLPKSGEAGKLTLTAEDYSTPQLAKLRWRGDLCWVTLADSKDMDASDMSKQALEELETLRRINETVPYPAWKEDSDGHLTWYNKAYAQLYEQTRGGPVSKNKALFSKRRMSPDNRVQIITGPDSAVDWFELTAVPSGKFTVYHATRITAVVSAEESQRTFVQTLAKTFAHLSIGLAIFDRNKQLALFNPALVDLTDLSAQFLSGRPDMLSFFDQLREKRRMPEPKNYLNWREEIADVIAAAADGRYEETWTLETGQTYNVKGRPHPDGATAFLIEDISAEMTLTRSFRAELEQAQLMLDKVGDAIALFSPAGVLIFSNAAFQTLWRIEPDTAFADVTLMDCAKIWKTRARSGDDIAAIEELMTDTDLRNKDGIILHLGDETAFRCQMTPVSSGATMVRFQPTRTQAENRVEQPTETVR